MFTMKVGIYAREEHVKVALPRQAPALLTNIRLGLEKLARYIHSVIDD
jgi:hypothetical protein